MPRVQGDGGRDCASRGRSNLDIHSMAVWRSRFAQMPLIALVFLRVSLRRQNCPTSDEVGVSDGVPFGREAA